MEQNPESNTESLGPLQFYNTVSVVKGYGLRVPKCGDVLLIGRSPDSCLRYYDLWRSVPSGPLSSSSEPPADETLKDVMMKSGRVPAEVSKQILYLGNAHYGRPVNFLEVNDINLGIFRNEDQYSTPGHPYSTPGQPLSPFLKRMLFDTDRWFEGAFLKNASYDDGKWREIREDGDDGAEQQAEFWGVWLIPSFINHSCTPHCTRQRVEDYLVIRAATQLAENDELSLPYFDVFKPVSVRDRFSKMWGFQCSCARCALDPKLADLDDCFILTYRQSENPSQDKRIPIFVRVVGDSTGEAQKQGDSFEENRPAVYDGDGKTVSKGIGIDVAPGAEERARAIARAIGRNLSDSIKEMKVRARVYITGLPLSSTKEEIRTFINKILKDVGAATGHEEPVHTIRVEQDPRLYQRNVATIHMKSEEQAANLVELSGALFPHESLMHPVPITIRRHKDFKVNFASCKPSRQLRLEASQLAGSDGLCFSVRRPGMTPEEIQSLLESRGPLQKFECSMDNGKSKGFGLCEYLDTLLGHHACKELNQVPVVLPVGQGIFSLRREMMSRVIAVIHSVCYVDDSDAVRYRNEMSNLVGSINAFCRNFGRIVETVVPIPREPGFGRIFVEFEGFTQARTAQARINQHRSSFPAGVAAYMYPEAYFQRRQLGA